MPDFADDEKQADYQYPAALTLARVLDADILRSHSTPPHPRAVQAQTLIAEHFRAAGVRPALQAAIVLELLGGRLLADLSDQDLADLVVRCQAVDGYLSAFHLLRTGELKRYTKPQPPPAPWPDEPI